MNTSLVVSAVPRENGMATVALFSGYRMIGRLAGGSNTIMAGAAAAYDGSMINLADTIKRDRVMTVFTYGGTLYVRW